MDNRLKSEQLIGAVDQVDLHVRFLREFEINFAGTYW
jgi:hypothetical protein